jgi:glyoxylase-like metal-dependent hydrolase (beta-lactamase superfamily II)
MCLSLGDCLDKQPKPQTMTRILYSLLLALALPASLFALAADNPMALRHDTKEPLQPLGTECLKLDFTETINTLEHDFDPWKLTTRSAKGSVWMTDNYFAKSDTLTLTDRNRTYYSKTVLRDSTLLFQDYGDENLFEVTQDMVAKQIIQSARYSPMFVLQYFKAHSMPHKSQGHKNAPVYEMMIGDSRVTMHLNQVSGDILRIVTYSYDELYGDVSTKFEYSSYKKSGNHSYPQTILITSLGGKIVDQVQVTAFSIQQALPDLLVQPAGYKMQPDVETAPHVQVEKYNEHTYFLSLMHTDDRVMVVEFADFLLVAEAPLNSRNGELILAEAKKIAPNKPVRYFVFGHHHPHYLGGIRPFVHAGAKIICVPENQEYVQGLASAQHTARPDMQQKEPQPVQFDLITKQKTITDGTFKMEIYFIGNQSQHTNDYLIYYFPAEKLLFEDDLVWIDREGEIAKASGRQAGLYQAVTALGLDIEIIVQSWPVADYGVKTIIPFADLEKSVKQ